VGFLKIGDRYTYHIPDVPDSLIFTMSDRCFRGVRKAAVDGLAMYELARLIVRGYEFSLSKDIPKKFDIKGIKIDLFKKPEVHDAEVCKEYLKAHREYWERRYNLDELCWVSDFWDIMNELGEEGGISDEWLKLFEIVRGPVPQLPNVVCFGHMIDDVADRLSNNTVRKFVRNYFDEHPEAVEIFLHGNLPDELPINMDVGLDIEEYEERARVLWERFVEKIEKEKKREAVLAGWADK